MRLSLVVVALGGGLAGFAVAACNRAPAEPASSSATVTSDPAAKPIASATPVASGTSTAAPKRCVVPTPDTPPPVAPPVAAGKCPPDPEGGPPFAKVAAVTFPDTNTSVDVELALSDAETERGLMYRTQMASSHGMLFAMEERKRQTFWMHNTCISLDMLFIDDDGTIVGILENVPTLNDDVRSVGCPSSYVLEVNAGWCRAHGVKAGQKAVLPPARPTR